MPSDCSDKSEVVTIVSGLPRSGTSLMMRMLEAGGLPTLVDGIRQADADNPRGYYEYEPVKRVREDASWLKEARGKVVKMVYLLLYDLPEDYCYRVVFMNRSMEEVIASQKAMLRRQGIEGGGLTDTQLAMAYAGQLQKLHVWLQKQHHIDVLQVRYNEIVTTPKEPASRIARFLDCGLDIEAMVQMVDPLLYHQRSDKNNT